MIDYTSDSMGLERDNLWIWGKSGIRMIDFTRDSIDLGMDSLWI